MTPCGFYLLFCRDSVCVRVCMRSLCSCSRAAEVCACLRLCASVCHFVNIATVLSMCRQKCRCCALCLTAADASLLGCLSESNTMSHLLDAIMKNLRISHAFPFLSSILSGHVDLFYYPTTACMAGCLMFLLWWHWMKWVCSLLNLQGLSRGLVKKARAKQANTSDALVCLCDTLKKKKNPDLALLKIRLLTQSQVVVECVNRVKVMFSSSDSTFWDCALQYCCIRLHCFTHATGLSPSHLFTVS